MAEEQSIHESMYLSDEGRRIRDEIHRLQPLIREHAFEGEKLGCLPGPTLQALYEADVFRLSTPRQFGGLELGARDLAEIFAALGRADGSAAWVAMVSSGFSRVALTFPDQTVEEVYGLSDTWKGPVIVGASLFSDKIQKARKVDGGYIVEAGGKWGFGSGCKHAAYVAVGVEVDDTRGMVLLQRDQYAIVDDWHVMGLSGSSSNSVTVESDVFVPEHRFSNIAMLPDNLNQLRNKYSGLGYQLDGLGLMLIVALETIALISGMARGAYHCFVEQTQNKKPFNLPYESLAQTPSIQVAAGKTNAMLNAAEALIFARADYIDRKAMAGDPFTPSEESEIMMDLVHAGNVAGQAADMIQIALGSFTVSLKNPIQRFVRDIRVGLTHGSIRLDPVAELSGRQRLGLMPFGEFTDGLPGVNKAKEKAAKAA